MSIHIVISQYPSTLAAAREALKEHLIPCVGLGVCESGNIYSVVPESCKTLQAHGIV